MAKSACNPSRNAPICSGISSAALSARRELQNIRGRGGKISGRILLRNSRTSEQQCVARFFQQVANVVARYGIAAQTYSNSLLDKLRERRHAVTQF